MLAVFLSSEPLRSWHQDIRPWLYYIWSRHLCTYNVIPSSKHSQHSGDYNWLLDGRPQIKCFFLVNISEVYSNSWNRVLFFEILLSVMKTIIKSIIKWKSNKTILYYITITIDKCNKWYCLLLIKILKSLIAEIYFRENWLTAK